MTTTTSIKELVQSQQKGAGWEPIFCIMLFEHPCKELVYSDGKQSGFPDIGHHYEAGFFHNIDDAVHELTENRYDIREHIYNAGFILCRFPGLYQSAGKKERLYFQWNPQSGRFFQQEEPDLFAHVAY